MRTAWFWLTTVLAVVAALAAGAAILVAGIRIVSGG